MIGLLFLLSGTLFNHVLSQVQYQVNSIFIGILSNGDSIVQYDLKLKPETQQIALPLIGGNVNDILVRNYLSKSLVYTFNSLSNEIKINSQNESQIRITYQTPDLVDKHEREWSFFIDSAFPFTVKLPNDAVVTNLGEQSPALIRKLGGQNLLSFDKGKISLDYVIGYAGTREQATISINSAELDLSKAENEHVGINLDEVKSILRNARGAMNQSNFIEAERLANNATDISRRITESFETSKDLINNATRKIKEAQAINVDFSEASEFVSKSNIEFSHGNYPKASEYASLAINSIDATKQKEPLANSGSTATLLLIPLLAAIVFLIIFKYRRKIIPNLKRNSTNDPMDSDLTPKPLKDVVFNGRESSIREHANNDNANTNKSDLHKLVADIIEKKGNLKQEEKEILLFISDKEGAAFEGEIRNKFIMPKTSLWRLVKRLERENLIEVIKIGGQNLIKLKIE